MTRSRQFRNRKGINGGCRSTGHARQTARKELMVDILPALKSGEDVKAANLGAFDPPVIARFSWCSP